MGSKIPCQYRIINHINCNKKSQSAKSYCLKYRDTKHMNKFIGAAAIIEFSSSGFKCDLEQK